MAAQGLSSAFERAGVWRRLAALLIDVIAVGVLLQVLALALYPLSHGRVQYAGGVFALSCSKLDKPPEGAAIPADFNANSIVDCRQTLLGLTSARILHVVRTTREGAVIRSVQIARMLDVDGTPIAAISLGILSLPLLFAWRLGFDLSRGTPGRTICRIRLASAVDGAPPSTAATCRRYALLFVVFSPLLIWSIAEVLWPESAADPGWLFGVALASYCPGLLVLLQAWRSVFRREDPWHDRFAGTCVLRIDGATTSAAGVDTVASGVGPHLQAGLSSLAIPPAQPAARHRWRNYFARHWRGELSLPQSWWVNGLVLAILAAVLVTMLASLLQSGASDDRPLIGAIGLCAIWSAIALLMLWQSVGIWRAAIASRASVHGIWSALARTTVVLGIAAVLWNFFTSGLPRIADAANIAAGDPQLGPHEWVAVDDILEFAGGIKFGAAKELESQLDVTPGVKTVRLNSPGGRIREAQRMSDVIKARGLSTLVEQQCLSACTIVFLGGKERTISSQARLGFHQPTTPGLSSVDRHAAIEVEEDRLQKLGLSRAFAERANKAEPTSMWFPDPSELVSEHVVTRVVPAEAIRSTAPAAATSSGKVLTDAASPVEEGQAQDISASSAPRSPVVSIPPDLLKRLRSSQSATRFPSSITGIK